MIMEPDENGVVHISVLIRFLVTLYGLTQVTVLAILRDYGCKNKNGLNARQFVNMMRKLNGINRSIAENSKEIFSIYDMDKNGYVDSNDLFEVNSLTSPSSTLMEAQELIKKFDKNRDNKLNFIEFTQFFINR